MFPDVLTALLDRVPDGAPAAVDGWRTPVVPGRVYPVLTPGAGVVSGRLLTGIAEPEWQVLDAFEDELYDLARLPLVGGGHAWAYTASDASSGGEEDWSAREFARAHLPAYVDRTRKWRVGQRISLTL